MKLKVLTLARTIKRKCFPTPPSVTEQHLKSLSESCYAYIEKNKIQPRYKVLWPTLFNQDQSWWAHDGVLILALKLRGVDVIPTMCDKLQSNQCMIHSGVWQGSFEAGFEERRKQLCDACVSYDLRLWDILNIRPLRLSSHLTEGERVSIWQEVKSIMNGDWETAFYQGYPLGYEIKKAVINNDLQGEIKASWRSQALEMAEQHMYNALAMFKTYQRIFDTIQPDAVVGNGGYYYHWGVAYYLSQRLGIPYYRYYPVGLQPNSWNYALNSTEIADLSPAWSSWIKQPWTTAKQDKVARDLKERGLILKPQAQPDYMAKLDALATQLNIKKNQPTMLLLTGVIWDANTNIKSDAFNNMYQWIWDTIEWFNQHPEFQLIIRVHPAEETVPHVAPQYRSRFETEMVAAGVTITDNIKIIKSYDKVETYDLMQLANFASVYMSTTGLEFACLGKPIITIGPVHYTKKGFTVEPKTKQAYIDTISQLLSQGNLDEPLDYGLIQELAMKYWYLYAFHSSTVTGLLEPVATASNWLAIKRGIDGFVVQLKSVQAQDIAPGANPYIDYFCESVINKLPIMGDNRWPPEIKEEFCRAREV